MRIKTAWFILIGALVVALPVRIYQMLFLVDPATGFFTDQNVVAICLAIFMIKMPQKDLNQSKIFRL